MPLATAIIQEISDVCEQVSEAEVHAVLSCIQKNHRIFVHGDGRSGLVIRCFAMRLMHLGYTVYVIGETITPAVEAVDVVIGVSGSGSSVSVQETLSRAKKKDATTIAVSAKANAFSEAADYSLIIPGALKGDQGEHRKSIQLLSSLFDQSLHVIMDMLALMLSYRDQVSNEQATLNHY